MASCSTPDLMADARCFFPLAGMGQVQAVKLALLCRILQAINPMASCDVNSLMADAKCFFPAVSAGMGQALELQLLCNIAAGDSGGGGIGDFTESRSGATDPTGPGGTVPIIYFQTTCKSIWYWDPIAKTWTEFDLSMATGSFAVPTIVELRSIPTIACPVVEAHTFGNLVVGDDQAAWYNFDPDSLDADNGMSVIKPDDRDDLTPGRWLQTVFA